MARVPPKATPTAPTARRHTPPSLDTSTWLIVERNGRGSSDPEIRSQNIVGIDNADKLLREWRKTPSRSNALTTMTKVSD